LEEFVTFCISEYRDNKKELLLKWEWQQENNIPGGIAEMPLAYLWSRSTKLKVLNLAIPQQEYGIFDNAMNQDGNYYDNFYVMDKFLHIKKVKYINKHPYFIECETKKLQKVDGLHFSTVTKKFMKDYSIYGRVLFRTYVKELCGKVVRKLG